MKNNTLKKLGIICTMFLLAIIGVCTWQNQRLNKEIQNKQSEIEELKTEIVERETEIKELKTEIEELSVSASDLDLCPFCGASPTLFTVKDFFYIECEQCDIKTGYFYSKAELKDYWNHISDTSSSN